MTLREIYAGIETAVKAGARADAAKVPSFAFGLAEAARGAAPPRVAFIPIDGKTRMPRTAGGDPIPLWNRRTSVDIHVWAVDAEALASRVIVALFEQRQGAYTIEGERWDTSGDGKTGQVLVLSCVFDLDWTTVVSETVEPTTLNVTQEIVQLEDS